MELLSEIVVVVHKTKVQADLFDDLPAGVVLVF